MILARVTLLFCVPLAILFPRLWSNESTTPKALSIETTQQITVSFIFEGLTGLATYANKSWFLLPDTDGFTVGRCIMEAHQPTLEISGATCLDDTGGTGCKFDLKGKEVDFSIVGDLIVPRPTLKYGEPADMADAAKPHWLYEVKHANWVKPRCFTGKCNQLGARVEAPWTTFSTCRLATDLINSINKTNFYKLQDPTIFGDEIDGERALSDALIFQRNDIPKEKFHIFLKDLTDQQVTKTIAVDPVGGVIIIVSNAHDYREADPCLRDDASGYYFIFYELLQSRPYRRPIPLYRRPTTNNYMPPTSCPFPIARLAQHRPACGGGGF